MMSIYELHVKLHDKDFDIIDEALPNRFSKGLGLWYRTKYGIETMTEAVRALKNFSDNNPEYVYRIVQVHYTTRSSTGKAN